MTVEADRVTLEGSVPRPEEVDRVERLTASVSGVTRVENRLVGRKPSLAWNPPLP